MTQENAITTTPRRRSVVRWLMHKRWRLTRSLTLGGQVCVIDADGRVLLVRHGYRPGWHFPGGGVEMGENVVAAALRELEEETGVVARGPPVLHGIFNHHAQFAGDHIVLFIVRTFDRPRLPAVSFEIAEHGFFSAQALPPGTNDGTRRRVREIFEGQTIDACW